MKSIVLTTLAAMVAFPAVAQTADTGLTFGGEVKLEYLDANPRIWAFFGDAGATWRSGGLLGFDASVDTTHLDNGSDYTNYWAALVLSTGLGEFALGAPRPVIDSLDPMPRFTSSRTVDLEYSLVSKSITSFYSKFDNGFTPGLTYQNTSGNLTFGGGVHRLNDGENADIFEAGMQYKAGATTLFITGEVADISGPNISAMRIGAFHDAERFDVGASFVQYRDSGTDHLLRLYGSFDVMDSLALRGDLLLVQDASDLYSLSATYALPNGLFVEGGGTKFQNGAEVYDIGVGLKF